MEDFDLIETGCDEVLTGLNQTCPLCFSQLSYRSMPGLNERHWFCKSCGTEWLAGDLVEALNNDEL